MPCVNTLLRAWLVDMKRFYPGLLLLFLLAAQLASGGSTAVVLSPGAQMLLDFRASFDNPEDLEWDGVEPCDWRGVDCYENGTIYGL